MLHVYRNESEAGTCVYVLFHVSCCAVKSGMLCENTENTGKQGQKRTLFFICNKLNLEKENIAYEYKERIGFKGISQ